MRVGFDIQAAAGGNRTGLFTHLRRVVGGLRPLLGDRLWLLADGRACGPGAAAELAAAFGGARVRLVRPPRRLYRLWHRASRCGRVDVLAHNLHGRLPRTPRGANVYVVPDVIPLAVDYGVPGFADGFRPFYEAAARHGDAVVVWSEHTRADLLARVGGDPARVHVCPLAAGPEFRPMDRAEVLPALGRHGLADAPYVLYVSTVEPRKNHAGLVRGFARAVAADPALPHRLVLVGKPWLGADAVSDLIRGLGLGDRVRHLGFVPEPDLPAVYAGADAFAFPSFYEGFGLPPLEAMACGVPVLAADASSLPEVVGGAGVLFDPRDDRAIADALRRVLADRPFRDDLAARGRARAASFSWGRTAAGYLDAFRAGYGRFAGGAA